MGGQNYYPYDYIVALVGERWIQLSVYERFFCTL